MTSTSPDARTSELLPRSSKGPRSAALRRSRRSPSWAERCDAFRGSFSVAETVELCFHMIFSYEKPELPEDLREPYEDVNNLNPMKTLSKFTCPTFSCVFLLRFEASKFHSGSLCRRRMLGKAKR